MDVFDLCHFAPLKWGYAKIWVGLELVELSRAMTFKLQRFFSVSEFEFMFITETEVTLGDVGRNPVVRDRDLPLVLQFRLQIQTPAMKQINCGMFRLQQGRFGQLIVPDRHCTNRSKFDF